MLEIDLLFLRLGIFSIVEADIYAKKKKYCMFVVAIGLYFPIYQIHFIMKRSMLVLGLIICSSIIYAQFNAFMEPDYGKIKQEISNPESAYYFPKLMERYSALDTTLTIEEFRHFYYGYMFQPQYQSYWSSPYQKDLEKLYHKEHLDMNDYDEIIRLASKSVQAFPFDVDNIEALAFFFDKKGYKEMSRKYTALFLSVVRTILSSGDGKTEESAYHVNSVSHEYLLLRLFGYHAVQQSLIQGKNGACDYLALADNNDNVKGIYFNVNQLFNISSEAFKKLKK